MKSGNRRKLRTIGLLMLASQVALGCICGQVAGGAVCCGERWFAQKIQTLYFETHDRIVDSLIEFNITAPIVKEEYKGDTTTIAAIEAFQMPANGAGTTVEVLHTPYDIVKKRVDRKGSDSLASFLARGVRTFVVKLSEEADRPFFLSTDSVKLKQEFERAMAKEQPGVHVLWNTKDPGNSIILDAGGSARREKGYVTGFRPIIIRKIAPQIGFSVFLLLLCGMAFTLSYITVSKQLRLSAQKDGFISNMSHELKTPVATAKVAIEALRKYNAIHDPVKAGDYLQMAAWEMDRLEALIGNVLNNVQMEHGTIPMQVQPVNLIMLIGDMVNSMQPLFAERNQDVNYKVETTAAIVDGDGLHIQGAIYNVLDNAIKYGGNCIEITLSRQQDNFVISIGDNGPGVPEEYRYKIFEKFFRIPSGDVHNVKGYGLGLDYTSYVLRAHGGSIRQENNLKGGASFIITLPGAQS